MVEHKEYNGWYNWDTWCLVLWMENDYDCYMGIKANKRELLSLSPLDLINEIIMASGCTDEIDTHNVYIDEVRQAIREL